MVFFFFGVDDCLDQTVIYVGHKFLHIGRSQHSISVEKIDVERTAFLQDNLGFIALFIQIPLVGLLREQTQGEPQRIGGCDGIVITADAYVGSPFTGLDGDGV